MREPEPRNLFTPADRPDQDQWFTRDPGAIAAHFGLAGRRPSRSTRTIRAIPKRYRAAARTVIAFPNNHLSYALTWFGLAAALAGVFGAWAWQRIQGQPPSWNSRPLAPRP